MNQDKITELRSRIDNIICERLDVDPDQINPDANLKDDLGADSLDRIELMMEIENKFHITIPDEVTEKIETVGQIYEYLQDVVRNY